MKWLRWLVVVIISLFLLVVHSFFGDLGSSVYTLAFLALCGGILCYLLLRETKDSRVTASKQVAIVGGILTILLFTKTIVLRLIQEQLIELGEAPAFGSILSIFGSGNFLSAIIIGVLFSGVPVLVSYLESRRD